METQAIRATAIRETLLGALRERAAFDPALLAPKDDPFAKLGLNSMEAFAVLVKLERELDVVIGEDVTDFDRLTTLEGLEALLLEKVQARTQAGAA